MGFGRMDGGACGCAVDAGKARSAKRDWVYAEVRGTWGVCRHGCVGFGVQRRYARCVSTLYPDIRRGVKKTQMGFGRMDGGACGCAAARGRHVPQDVAGVCRRASARGARRVWVTS